MEKRKITFSEFERHIAEFKKANNESLEDYNGSPDTYIIRKSFLDLYGYNVIFSPDGIYGFLPDDTVELIEG